MRLRIVAVLVLVAAGLAVGTGSASAAALPTCNHFTTIDANIPKFERGTIRVPSTGPDSRNFSCALRPRDHNWGVVALQLALNACANAGLTVDGVYGQPTQNAVTWMQALAGITVDGVYGPQTRAKAIKMPSVRADGSLIVCVQVVS